MQLKAYQATKQTTENTPNMTENQRINKIVSAQFKDTKYKNKDGEMQQVVIISTDNGSFHSTAKAIVDTLYNYFVEEKNTEPLTDVEVVELKSKDGRAYLALKGF